MKMHRSIPLEMSHQCVSELSKVWVPRSIKVTTSEDNSDYADRKMTALSYVCEITMNRQKW